MRWPYVKNSLRWPFRFHSRDQKSYEVAICWQSTGSGQTPRLYARRRHPPGGSTPGRACLRRTHVAVCTVRDARGCGRGLHRFAVRRRPGPFVLRHGGDRCLPSCTRRWPASSRCPRPRPHMVLARRGRRLGHTHVGRHVGSRHSTVRPLLHRQSSRSSRPGTRKQTHQDFGFLPTRVW